MLDNASWSSPQRVLPKEVKLHMLRASRYCVRWVLMLQSISTQHGKKYASGRRQSRLDIYMGCGIRNSASMPATTMELSSAMKKRASRARHSSIFIHLQLGTTLASVSLLTTAMYA